MFKYSELVLVKSFHWKLDVYILPQFVARTSIKYKVLNFANLRSVSEQATADIVDTINILTEGDLNTNNMEEKTTICNEWVDNCEWRNCGFL